MPLYGSTENTTTQAIYPYRNLLSKGIIDTYRTNQGADGDAVQQKIIEDSLGPLIGSTAWQKIKELAVFTGNNLTGALVKIKAGTGLSSSLGIWGTPTYDNSTGITFDGSTNGALTGFIAASQGMVRESICYGVHAATIGGNNGAIIGNDANTYNYLTSAAGVLGGIGLISGVSLGFRAINSFEGNVGLWTNKIKLVNSSSAQTQSLGSLQVCVGGKLDNNASYAWAGSLNGYFISSGLTDIEMGLISDFFNDVAVRLGRNTVAKLIALGDSIPYGVGASDQAHKYVDIVSKAFGITLQNGAISGSTVSFYSGAGVGSWHPAINTTPASGYLLTQAYYTGNLYLLHCGINDVRQVYGTFNAATTIADIDDCIDYLIRFGIDKNQIILGNVTYSTSASYDQARADQVNAGIANIVNKYGIIGADFQTVSKNTSGFLSGDGIHPSDAGHAALAVETINKITANYKALLPAYISI